MQRVQMEETVLRCLYKTHTKTKKMWILSTALIEKRYDVKVVREVYVPVTARLLLFFLHRVQRRVSKGILRDQILASDLDKPVRFYNSSLQLKDISLKWICPAPSCVQYICGVQLRAACFHSVIVQVCNSRANIKERSLRLRWRCFWKCICRAWKRNL